MSKTPYEIRLNLLDMAKSMCENNWHAKREQIQQEWYWQADIAKENKQPLPPKPHVEPLSEDEFIKVAERLNAFINKKD